ncbi:MAG: ATP-binding protein, partial [Bacteroidales bacterium]
NRAFTNIIKNAVQAFVDDRRGLIKINISSENWKAIITIEDNGSGIPEAELTKIFEPNFTTKTSGSGLGLAIVKNIINDLNGQIYVESRVGEGSKFTIVLMTLK